MTAILETTRLFLLALFLARTLTRTLVLRWTGFLHGASETNCPHRTTCDRQASEW